MNAKQKKFILDKLIPFIMREQGRGFEMSDWRFERRDGAYREGTKLGFYESGDLKKDVEWPKCNTVACIGGSAELLLKTGREIDTAKKLGLSEGEFNGLCYCWEKRQISDLDSTTSKKWGAWPEKYMARWAAAKTKLAKAKVACDLLREVVKTEGKCLHRDSDI